jgi:hypothetical protein
MKHRKEFWEGIYGPTSLLIVGYAAIALFLTSVLRFDFFPEIRGYWQDSLNWQTPFDPYHVPGYPLLVALARGITFDSLPAVPLMMGVNLIAFLVSVWLIFRLVEASGASPKQAAIGAYLFGLWPFVGLFYTVDPGADLPAIALLLGGVLAIINSKTWAGSFLLGLSLVTHKAMWPFVCFIVASEVLYTRSGFVRKNRGALAIIFLPIFFLWLFGTFYHSSPAWIVSANVSTEIASRSTLPILDGVLGTLKRGGIKGIAKGGVIVGSSLIAILLLICSWRSRNRFSRLGAAFALASLLLFVVLNSFEIWGAVRFSRLLVLPLIWNDIEARRFDSLWKNPIALGLGLTSLIVSQFAFAWYVAKVFFA